MSPFLPHDLIDVQRAAGAQDYSASATTAGQEPLIVDLLPTPTTGKHWIAEQVCCLANLVTRAPADARGMQPLSGLFLCPPGTPIETLAQAQGTTWNRDARPYALPLSDPLLNFGQLGAGPPYAIALTLIAGFKVTVPYGWFLRAIVTCQQGTASPGPGTASQGKLRALMTLEADDPCV